MHVGLEDALQEIDIIDFISSQKKVNNELNVAYFDHMKYPLLPADHDAKAKMPSFSIDYLLNGLSENSQTSISFS
jgi:hypothetical protein